MTESVRVYEALRNDIILCELEAGASVSEAELCARYQAGRTPVREACRRLQEENLIRIIPFRGYSIADLPLSEFINLQEVQNAIEPLAAELAAKNADSAQIRRIAKLAQFEYQPRHATSYRRFLEVNYEFHSEIAAASGNEILHDIVMNLQARLMRYFYRVISLDSFGIELAAEHKAIAAAITEHKPARARQMIEEHLRKTRERSAKLNFGAPGARTR